MVAPYGNFTFLIDEIFITNMGNTTIQNFEHFEFWDLNNWQLRVEWPRTGYFAPPGDKLRHDLNNKFQQSVSFNQTANSLLSTMYYYENGSSVPPVAHNESAEINYFPQSIFLTSLIGEVTSVSIFIATRPSITKIDSGLDLLESNEFFWQRKLLSPRGRREQLSIGQFSVRNSFCAGSAIHTSYEILDLLHKSR